MASNLPNNAVDLIRQALADLEMRRSRLASELADLESEVKKHRTALSALTGETAPGRAVTKVQVRNELIALLRETPGQARPRDEVLGETEDFDVGEGDVVSLTAEGDQRAAS